MVSGAHRQPSGGHRAVTAAARLARRPVRRPDSRYGSPVSPARRCSRSACGRKATSTLTYVYADSTAVLGPLATYAEPHCYDLCAEHSGRLVAPNGWEVVRIAPDPASLRPSSDDLLALADAVREAARPQPADWGRINEVGRRGHLRVLRDPDA